MTSFKSTVAASYAIFKGCFNGTFQTGNVSNLEYPTSFPLLFSWYNWLKQVPSFPLFGPGAVTTTIGFVVSIYGLAPYPSSLTIVSTSLGYPFVGACLYTFIPLRSN